MKGEKVDWAPALTGNEVRPVDAVIAEVEFRMVRLGDLLRGLHELRQEWPGPDGIRGKASDGTFLRMAQNPLNKPVAGLYGKKNLTEPVSAQGLRRGKEKKAAGPPSAVARRMVKTLPLPKSFRPVILAGSED